MVFLHLIVESIKQAVGQLNSNRLRSFLSLVGIAIGILCVISVLSAVDSLEISVRKSLSQLGNNVVYVGKQPFGEDPEMNYWKYLSRPDPSYRDFLALKRHVRSAEGVACLYFAGAKSVSYRSGSLSNCFITGMTYDFGQIQGFEYAHGRYFSPIEDYFGSPTVVIGYKVYESLFAAGENPIDKKIKVNGYKLKVVGVLTKKEKDILDMFNFDEAVLISYKTAQKVMGIHGGTPAGFISAKVKEGVSIAQLKDDMTMVLRAQRRLKPIEPENFALNTLSMLEGLTSAVFGAIGFAGGFIGIFSILVGGFGVANIMFVSVKERTNIIGIKKALGAKRYIILLEFLIESIILCVLGGIFGLGLVYALIQLGNRLVDFEFVLTAQNVILGLSVSIILGIVAGVIPAWQAARMDPVEAIRS